MNSEQNLKRPQKYCLLHFFRIDSRSTVVPALLDIGNLLENRAGDLSNPTHVLAQCDEHEILYRAARSW